MSNTLYIAVVQFKDVASGNTTYGFTASDSYGQHFEDGWDTLSDFLQSFPTDVALQAHVFTTDAFSGFHEDSFGGSGNVSISFPES